MNTLATVYSNNDQIAIELKRKAVLFGLIKQTSILYFQLRVFYDKVKNYIFLKKKSFFIKCI